MYWSVPKIWQNADVWILGGGPSIPKQFDIPDEVVQSVLEKKNNASVYSDYMSFLHNKHVIGINMAYKIGNWIDIVFFGDDVYFNKNCYALSQLPILKCSCAPETKDIVWVKYLQKDHSKTFGINVNSTKVSWNHNSGGAAISLAANAGAKRIMLLGFDMDWLNGAQHWHSDYKYIKPKEEIAENFRKHMKGFDSIVKDAKERGIEIFNISPDSKIKELPKLSLTEFISATNEQLTKLWKTF